MAVVARQQLLESGVHFGHQTRRWNPKMAPYIFTQRNGIHIIDLNKTADCIEVAYKALFDIIFAGGKVLFIGTKKQAQEAVKEEAIRTGQYYVDQRWLGGTLTNFKTIRRRIKYLHDLYKMEEDGIFEKLPKKEVLKLKHVRERLEKFIGGIKEMKKVPEAIFVVDPKEEINAVKEARKLNIPIFGIVDTNCDPEDVDYVIPANDDAIKAVKLVAWVMGNAVIEAQGGVVEKFDDEKLEAIVVSDDADAKTNKKPVKPAPVKVEQKVADEPKAKVVKEPKKEEKVVEPVVEAKPVKAKKETAEPKEEKKPVKKTVAPKVETKPVKEATPKVEVVKTVTVETKLVVDLNSLSLVDLKSLAKDKGLKGYSALKKQELIDLLNK